MVEHITGNLYRLGDDEFVGESPEKGICGPAIVRLDDHTNIGLIGVQTEKMRLEVDGHELADFQKAVKKIPED